MKAKRPTIDQIRDRAFEIYLKRGAQPGHQLDDWLQAESELRQASPGASAADAPGSPRPGHIAFFVSSDGIAIKV